MKIANAPCSWGVLEFDLEGEVAGYVQVLDEMRQTGYAGTELGDWGFMPTHPATLKKELKARELSLLGAFVPVALVNLQAHTEGEAVALRTARLLVDVAGNTPFIVLADDNGTVHLRTKHAGRVQPEHELSPDGWKVFADGVNRIAQAVRDQTGLRTVFHHHCAGYVETPAEVETLMRLTDPVIVGLCFDTGHYRFGGGDPVEGLKEHADRIWHVHFKDCHSDVASQSRAQEWNYFESVANGVFCELGKGEVDFPAVITELEKRDYDGWIVVEQDVLPGMGSPKESAQRNREYLRRVRILSNV
ncbi:TIM barrel protein [Candidatus Poribacteria bacterium]|nr:TIM barrel protein [Candidatus Poribacteria bacterium]